MTSAIPTPPAANPQRSALRRRGLVVVLLLLLAAGAASWWWYRHTRVMTPPVADLEGIDPAVAAVITKERQAVLAAPRDASAWGRLGEVLELFNFRKDARVCLMQAERLDPEQPRWPYHQGFLLLWDNAEEALPHLRRAVELEDRQHAGPAGDAMRLRLSETLLTQGHLDEAEESFRRLLKRDVLNPRVHLGLGRLAMQRQEWKEALSHLQQAAADKRTIRAATLALAELYEQRGDEPAAAQARVQQEKLPLDPSWPDPFVDEIQRFNTGKRTRLMQADQLFKQGRTAEAIAQYGQVVKDYANSDEAWFALGQALYRAGDFASAQRTLQKTVELKPGYAEAYNYLGLTFVAQEKREDAAASFQKATELKKDFGHAYFNLGRCRLEQKNIPAALDAFRGAVRSMPNYAAAHTALAELLHQIHQDAEALDEVRQALQLSPEDERAKQLREKLKAKK
ncbi:MAG TPA: tetratricopeptide repeat protein [Gemmataceae bacterium]|jgi:tetratricopeptide (TPR) repeat protein